VIRQEEFIDALGRRRLRGIADCEACGRTFRAERSTMKFCSVPCMGAGRTKRAINSFWQHVDKTGDCWVWTGATAHNGYGVLGVGGKQLKAHRFSWTLTNGTISDGLFVCHRCDNPPCVRPDHLFLGTVQDNTADMVAKGRQNQGDKHWTRLEPARAAEVARGNTGRAFGTANAMAKLNESLVREIRQRRAAGESTYSLAAAFGVSRPSICSILNGETWSWCV
jgi:hypothetical protein